MNLRQCRNGNRDVRNNHQVAGSRGSKRSLYQHLTTRPVLDPVPGPLNQYQPGPAPPHATDPSEPAHLSTPGSGT